MKEIEALEFQFLIGTLKTSPMQQLGADLGRFQFLIGTLKTKGVNSIGLFDRCFNSS